MRTYLDCIPCFFNQIIRTGRMLGMDEAVIRDMMDEFASGVPGLPMNVPPPRSAIALYDMIAKRAGTEDPFKEMKEKSTKEALTYYQDLKKKVSTSPNPVATAVRFAIAGNIIDFGISTDFDLDAEIGAVLQGASKGIWQEDELLAALEGSPWLLYLADNTGETVFDRLLIETLGKPVVYAVRGGPIINDATIDDAIAAGLDQPNITLVSSGCRAPGTILELCSAEFKEYFSAAPVIISKGQGNYETLSGTEAPIFYLLKAKCSVVAAHLGVRQGDLIITR